MRVLTLRGGPSHPNCHFYAEALLAWGLRVRVWPPKGFADLRGFSRSAPLKSGWGPPHPNLNAKWPPGRVTAFSAFFRQTNMFYMYLYCAIPYIHSICSKASF